MAFVGLDWQCRLGVFCIEPWDQRKITLSSFLPFFLSSSLPLFSSVIWFQVKLVFKRNMIRWATEIKLMSFCKKKNVVTLECVFLKGLQFAKFFKVLCLYCAQHVGLDYGPQLIWLSDGGHPNEVGSDTTNQTCLCVAWLTGTWVDVLYVNEVCRLFTSEL